MPAVRLDGGGRWCARKPPVTQHSCKATAVIVDEACARLLHRLPPKLGRLKPAADSIDAYVPACLAKVICIPDEAVIAIVDLLRTASTTLHKLSRKSAGLTSTHVANSQCKNIAESSQCLQRLPQCTYAQTSIVFPPTPFLTQLASPSLLCASFH